MNVRAYQETMAHAYQELRDTVEAAHTEFTNRLRSITAEFMGDDVPEEIPYDTSKLESLRRSRDI